MLALQSVACDSSFVKVLAVVDAQKELDSVCQQALAGEVIRLQLANGALIELSPVAPFPKVPSVCDGIGWLLR